MTVENEHDRDTPADGALVTPSGTVPAEKPPRVLSLDAYRGFIMVMLAAGGFGIAGVAALPHDAPVWQTLDHGFWQGLGFHFRHPQWVSRSGWIGVSFWDLIQPAFMFMVGVAMPYSFARREEVGHSGRRQLGHALWRALVLTLLGVFLQSQRTPQTSWIFTNVLSQIGLGYVFLYLLLGRRLATQIAVFVVILVGYWAFFKTYTAPADYDHAAVGAGAETIFEGGFASWSKNANAGFRFDLWFLNLFSPPGGDFRYNGGGYLTLNFVPSIATMLLGVFCGHILRSERKRWQILGLLVVAGAACMALGLLSGELVCPIVKRIWTPSWVLFSGGWVIWMLAAFYLVFDLLALRRLAFPLVVVGMNSIVMYLMGQLMRSWTVKMVNTHLGGTLEWILGAGALADDMYGRLVGPTLAFVVFWLIAFWMYRKKLFVRV